MKTLFLNYLVIIAIRPATFKLFPKVLVILGLKLIYVGAYDPKNKKENPSKISNENFQIKSSIDTCSIVMHIYPSVTEQPQTIEYLLGDRKLTVLSFVFFTVHFSRI